MFKNRRFILASSLGIAILGGVTAFAFWQASLPSETTTTSAPVLQEDNFVEDESQPLTNGPPGEKDKTLIPQNTSSSDEDLEKPLLVRAEQSGNNIKVSIMLTKPSSGECFLVLEKPSTGEQVTRNSTIIVGPSYYTCNGFNIPKNELSAGEWEAQVFHKSAGKTVESDTKTIAIE